MCLHEDKVDVGQFLICPDCGRHFSKEKKKSGLWSYFDELKEIITNTGKER